MAAVAGCAGEISQPGGGSVDGPPSSTQACNANTPGPSPLRRITRQQYENTIQELFQGAVTPSAKFPQAHVVDTFSNDLTRNIVDQVGAEAIADAAEDVSTALATVMPAWLGCDPAAKSEAACLDVFLSEQAPRIQRRPLDAAETQTLKKLFDTVRPLSIDFSSALAELVRAELMSPQFLYLDERADPALQDGARVRFDDYQIASKLSYLLWDSMPDATLFQHAAAGQLRTKAQVRAEAERMLEDPRAHATVGRFYREWLQLPRLDDAVKDATEFPQFGPALVASMKEEVTRFADQITWGPSATLDALLLEHHRPVDASLAAMYGVQAPSDWSTVELPADQRAGLLTTAAFLSAHAHPGRTSPTKRGRFVREGLLCQPMKPPPANVDTTLPAKDPTKTLKEQLALHRSDPTCASCHDAMDPIGFGFEHYDALGTWRTADGQQPVDATGEILKSKSADGTFDGALELSAHLAQSPQVKSCFAAQWYRFAAGRPLESGDDCQVRILGDEFVGSGTDLRALIVELTQTQSFLYRPPADMEAAP